MGTQTQACTLGSRRAVEAEACALHAWAMLDTTWLRVCVGLGRTLEAYLLARRGRTRRGEVELLHLRALLLLNAWHAEVARALKDLLVQVSERPQRLGDGGLLHMRHLWSADFECRSEKMERPAEASLS